MVDLHSYQPTAQDILKISTCDLFIYVGGESDGWVSDALQEAANKDMKVIDLLDVLDDAVKEEEIVEGMEAGEEHGDGEDEEHEEEEEGPEYDEHVWLSLRNAKVLCEAITNALTEIDPDHAADYRSNLTSYSEKLDALDAAYQSAVDSASGKRCSLATDSLSDTLWMITASAIMPHSPDALQKQKPASGQSPSWPIKWMSSTLPPFLP